MRAGEDCKSILRSSSLSSSSLSPKRLGILSSSFLDFFDVYVFRCLTAALISSSQALILDSFGWLPRRACLKILMFALRLAIKRIPCFFIILNPQSYLTYFHAHQTYTTVQYTFFGGNSHRHFPLGGVMA